MSAPVTEGEVLGGKYRVERVLGEGGMGVVVAATHLQLQERVALKFLLVEVSQESEIATRFLREAQAAVKIKSEHVARVIDVGTLEGGSPFMVMEYLEGHDLQALLERRGRLPVELAVEFILQAGQAIDAAHRAGIVHRDLKPGNLFLTERSDGSNCIKVLDFGISKMVDPAGSGASLTKTTGTFGTPAYMSPEQLRSARDVDARTDIWSLGVILYELLVGELPFIAQSVPELCAAILTYPAPKLRAHLPDAPQELERIICACLEKDAAKRPATVADLARALAPFTSPERAVRTSAQWFASTPGARRSSADCGELHPTELAPDARSASADEGDDLVAPARRRPIAVISIFAALAIAGVLGWRVIAGGGSEVAPTAASSVTAPAPDSPRIDGAGSAQPIEATAGSTAIEAPTVSPASSSTVGAPSATQARAGAAPRGASARAPRTGAPPAPPPPPAKGEVDFGGRR